MVIQDRLAALRAAMKQNKIDIYIIPTSDFHSSEYVGAYFHTREFFSGFTGSAGTLVVTMNEARLWTDGRYFLQAADQLKDTGIILMKQGQEGVPAIEEYLKEQLKEGQQLAFDGRVFTSALGKKYAEVAKEQKAAVRFDLDLAEGIWTDRPALSAEPIYIHPTTFAGVDASDKLLDVRSEMDKHGCDTHILTALDSIAWLLNLRGSDVDCNPVFLSYLIITKEGGILFAAPSAIDSAVNDYLDDLGIAVREYNDIYEYVKTLDKSSKILIDEDTLNYALYSTLQSTCEIVCAENPTTIMKATKNSTEMECLRNVNIHDGVAMVKMLCWLDKTIGRQPLTELSICDKLVELRSQQPDFKGISFETIAGYNAHGAIIHYEPTTETDIPLAPEGLLLIDSGAQYLGGTTDITRTVALGPVTPEMKHHYTLVLKGNINVSRAIFPEGCSGANLDILARQPFWDEHSDFNHGTGHGVGFFLNVHEGPHSLNWSPRRKSSTVPFREGMVVTDEPGFYLEGKYGIRIENDLLCRQDVKNEYGQFMRWEILTLCPIDMRPVNIDELTAAERSAINAYHAEVKRLLTPHLDKEEAEWLANATKAI